jgi:RNA polymerase sigma-70 factor (family 1)
VGLCVIENRKFVILRQILRLPLPKNCLYNERELLQRVAEGDQKAFQSLFDCYWDKIYANALHFTKSPPLAQDLAQEIFIKIWMQRARLAEVRQFAPFLYTVSRNMILDEFRKRVLPVIHEEIYDACFESDLATGQDKLELQDVERNILTAINHLPAQMQLAFKLSRFQGLTHEQIAQRMNISRVTSRNYIARAIAAIRKDLTDNSGKLLLLLWVLWSS